MIYPQEIHKVSKERKPQLRLTTQGALKLPRSNSSQIRPLTTPTPKGSKVQVSKMREKQAKRQKEQNLTYFSWNSSSIKSLELEIKSAVLGTQLLCLTVLPFPGMLLSVARVK